MRSLAAVAPTLLEAYPRSYYEPDTLKEGLGLDLRTAQGSFLALCLGILYAFPIEPAIADKVLRAICATTRTKELFVSKLLADAYAKCIASCDDGALLDAIPKVLPEQYNLIEGTYRRIPRVVLLSIAKAAHRVETELSGNPTHLYEACNYDGVAVVKRLQSWRVRLDIKAFWLCREMRQQGVWRKPDGERIDGGVCCVVDVQVRRALEHLGCYDKERDSFYHSQLIWDAFGEYYDFPLLWLARHYCSRRHASECPMRRQELCGGKRDQLPLRYETE